MEKSARLGSEECDARRQELTEKLSQLEIRISKAVELEDYDLAGTTIHVCCGCILLQFTGLYFQCYCIYNVLVIHSSLQFTR